MRFLILSCVFASLGIGGCASVNQMKYPLPKCNGYNKRALNKSMWDWQDKTPVIVNNFAVDSPNPAHEIFADVTSSDAQAASEAKSLENCE